MRIVLQRVSRASVAVDGKVVAEIGVGFLLLVGAGANDREGEIERLADKIVNLRVFADDEDRMNRSLAEVSGEILVVSQFTLFGDVRKGRRPSWTKAAPPEIARDRIEAFCRALQDRGAPVRRGVFGAHMHLELENDGPVTLVLDGADLVL
jgi:D-tyrosyl-tRNA(Tyr) deacylase